ncbi:MAG: hypothetical protein FJ241_10490 [Nitrospira sp.]|nr:hypothetical protein [Nitrospira sp.]
MRKFLKLFILLMLPLIALYGCGSSSVSDTKAGITKTGNLVVSAKFPQNGQKGQIGTAFIDEDTYYIMVTVTDAAGDDYILDLTPENNTGTVPNIPVGQIYITINTWDSQDNNLDYLELAGTIVEGNNTLTATLLRGNWQLVDDFETPSPVSIQLNKTLSADTTTITDFSLITSGYGYASAKKAAIDLEEEFGVSIYDIIAFGSGFSLDYCDSTEYCIGYEGVSYYNQFAGPSTTNNALNSDEGMPLEPDTQYPIPEEADSNRTAVFSGIIPPEGEFSDPDALNYFNTRVTGANTIEGTLIEMLIKSETDSVQCFDVNGVTTPEPGDSNVLITCPFPQGQSVKKAINKSIVKALTQRSGVKRSAPDQEGCFRNIQTSDSYSNTVNVYDLNQDGQNDPMNIVSSFGWTGDACVHPFKALGSQLPPEHLDLMVAKKAKK